MDYKKIRLANERSTHVTKRLNRLSTFRFFGVLYRDNMFRLLGFSLLMLLCFVPILVVQYNSAYNVSAYKATLPTLNFFGFSTGVWQNVGETYSEFVSQNNLFYGFFTVIASLLLSLVFSCGFAVIRDAFWTGKLSTVGVFRSAGKGFCAGIGYAFVSTAILASSIFGIYLFYAWAISATFAWLAIVLTVVLSLLAFLLACYLMILCSVAVTYKQSFYENLDDSWRLLWLNILPNILHLLIALLPIPIYLLVSGGALYSLFLAFMLILGGMYFPLVWQTHMMKTFALFHPVEAKKKKELRREEASSKAEVKNDNLPDESSRGAKKKKNGNPDVSQQQQQSGDSDEVSQMSEPTNDDGGESSQNSD